MRGRVARRWSGTRNTPGTGVARFRTSWPAAKIPSVPSPAADEILGRALALPGVGPLIARLDEARSPQVLLVGGAVRDLLLGATVIDIDLAVEGPLEEVVPRLDGAVRAHDRFGTATVEVDGVLLDIARTRRESYPEPGALPVVAPASIEEDLRRRDFTVNAIALGLTGERRGELIAAGGALEDLQRGLMRVLHDRSFLDDPTRLLRLARYAARLGFDVEPVTLELARSALSADTLATVSGSRIGHEVRLLIRESDPIAPWRHLRDLGIDEAIAPGFGLSDPDLAARALGFMPADGRAEVVVLALALAGVAEDGRAPLLDRLAFSARVRDDALTVAARSDGVTQSLRAVERPSEVARVIESAGGGDAAPELASVAAALGAEAPAKLWLGELRSVRAQITGEDLLAAGVPSGPAIGAGLRGARAALLDGDADSREEQLQAALRAARRTD